MSELKKSKLCGIASFSLLRSAAATPASAVLLIGEWHNQGFDCLDKDHGHLIDLLQHLVSFDLFLEMDLSEAKTRSGKEVVYPASPSPLQLCHKEYVCGEKSDQVSLSFFDFRHSEERSPEERSPFTHFYNGFSTMFNVCDYEIRNCSSYPPTGNTLLTLDKTSFRMLQSCSLQTQTTDEFPALPKIVSDAIHFIQNEKIKIYLEHKVKKFPSVCEKERLPLSRCREAYKRFCEETSATALFYQQIVNDCYRLMTLAAHGVDYFALAKMFAAEHSSRIKVVVAGRGHTQHLRQMLEDLDFRLIFHQESEISMKTIHCSIPWALLSSLQRHS